MKTVLDLIQEFAVLDEAKTLSGGILPGDSEKRWSELKVFYRLLMGQEGLSSESTRRYTPRDIRRTVTARKRLRVNIDMETVIIHEGQHYRCRVANLSRGGLLIMCEKVFDVASRLTVHLPVTSQDQLMALTAEVVWCSDQGKVMGKDRYRMGVRLLDVDVSKESSLDSLVVQSIERQLLSFAPSLLDTDFVLRERLQL